MKPNANHVEPLKKYKATDFATWLISGFRDMEQKDEGKKLKAFAPLHYFVGQSDDLTGELKAIYDLLYNFGYDNEFRSGIAIAFSRAN